MGCYIPGTEQEQLEMLKSIGFDSFDGLFSHIPQQVRLESGLNLPEGLKRAGGHPEKWRIPQRKIPCSATFSAEPELTTTTYPPS